MARRDPSGMAKGRAGVFLSRGAMPEGGECVLIPRRPRYIDGMAGKVVYDRLVFYPGDEIFTQGEEGNWAYLIQSGQIEIAKAKPDGSLTRLALLGPGKVFGEMALIENQPRMATARAVQESVVILISAELIQEKVSRSDPLVRALLQNLSDNLRASGAAKQSTTG